MRDTLKLNRKLEGRDPQRPRCRRRHDIYNGFHESKLGDKEIEDFYEQVELEKNTSSVHFTPKIKWIDLSLLIFIHFGLIYGFYYLITGQALFFTYIWTIFLFHISGLGVTAGIHRLWSHKSYKAKWQLRLLLMFMYTISGQYAAYTWIRDHRIHHKYSETDADPHDSRRGLFFSHVGWVFQTSHPEVEAKRKSIDMSDIEKDPIVMWQKKYYTVLFGLLGVILPTIIPWYLWHENLWIAFWTNCFRGCFLLNVTFSINSLAHTFGTKPYDSSIYPGENKYLSYLALGEGFHNYHHVFPWDYKTNELGGYFYDKTTAFIDLMAKVGLAYDCKIASKHKISRKIITCGDDSYQQ